MTDAVPAFRLTFAPYTLAQTAVAGPPAAPGGTKKLVYARVFVRDFDVAQRFYGEMLQLKRLWVDDAAGHAGFDGEGCTLIVERLDEEGTYLDSLGRLPGLSCQVADIEAAFRELSGRGVWFTQAPAKMTWGSTGAYFRDYDCTSITVVQPHEA